MKKLPNDFGYQLDEYEKEVLQGLDKEGYKSIPNLKKEIERYRAAARATLTKKRNINIRISEVDLLKVKAKAAQKGLPYQTMITSLIHQYSTGQIKD